MFSSLAGKQFKMGLVVQAYNSSYLERQDRKMSSPKPPGLQCKFKANLGISETLVQKPVN